MDKTAISAEELNLAMADALGYKSAGRTGMFAILVLRPGTDQPVAPPDFCNDRNTLPEIVAILDIDGKGLAFGNALYCAGEWERPLYCHNKIPLELLMIPQRSIVIAALKALDKWPQEWDEPPQERLCIVCGLTEECGLRCPDEHGEPDPAAPLVCTMETRP